ncbi:hypothetical protein NKG05_26115 [Oerskovia sp. M15]
MPSKPPQGTRCTSSSLTPRSGHVAPPTCREARQARPRTRLVADWERLWLAGAPATRYLEEVAA